MGSTVLQSAAVRDAVERSPEPALARTRVGLVAEAHPDLGARLAAGGPLLDGLLAVAVASNSLFAGILADPEAIDLLLGDDALAAERTRVELDDAARASLAADPDPQRALRRWRRREMVRIAARDLLGVSDLRAVGRELSALAGAALDAALGLATPSVPLAIVGMGKLGGGELNYASDVDVIFVHAGDESEAERAARHVLATMTTRTADGVLFRTDVDLRPQGRSGALTRSMESFETYWERWAQTWEFQALIKARPVAGPPELGAALVARSERFVWPERLDPDAVREIRLMKGRTEAMLRSRGLDERELKRGRGGIRDIEFAVQLLQLVHGRHDRSVRSATTLDALEQLAAGGYISFPEATSLDEAYVWLRTVEHRLQLVDEQQTHTLPVAAEARLHLARLLGFRDGPDASAVEQFDGTHASYQTAVRELHEKMFFAPLLDTLAGAGPLPPDAVEERLRAFGFRDVARTREALAELTSGLTRRSRVMQQLMPVILGWLSQAPDPDLGLLQLRRLTEGPTRSSMLSRRFRETPVAAERTCRILGSSRVLGLALHRQPEFVDVLADDVALGRELTRDEMVSEALDTLDWRHDEEGRRAGLRRFKRRHLLRIGARDVLELDGVEAAGRELSNLADAALEAALRSLEPRLPFAVIGMGRFGGCELSYASDIDVLFVFAGEGPSDFAEAEQTATRLMRAIGETTAEGNTFRIDAGLRPEGRAGPLARSLAAYRAYYERWVQTWELQSLTRARPVAGDAEVARAFMELVTPHVYRERLGDEARREIRRMKARVERERIPPAEDPRFHLKLGKGTLSDVEWAVQLLQLEHGGAHPEVRLPSTIAALRALVDVGIVDRDDAEVLTASYRLCERARNYRYLLTGTPGDSLPGDGEEAERLGRMLGFAHRPQASLREEYRRVTRRARAVFERLFYGTD